MIKNIVFDMGGVLMDFNPRHFVAQCDVSDEDRELLLDAVFVNGEWILVDWGLLSEDGLYEKACSKLPERLHPYAKEMVYGWDKYFLMVPGTAAVAKELKEKGYKLYLLSNAGPRHPEYWPRIDGHELFDGLVVSAFEKLMKPMPEIYDVLFERFELNPKECVFIDDSQRNIAAALVKGMDGILFKNAEKLRAELVDRGLL